MLFETDKNKIGNKIKEYRKSRKLTQAELAEKVNLNEKQISRIEAGLNYPTYLTFAKIINVLSIDIDEFNINVEKKPNPLKKEIEKIIKNSTEYELKIYIEMLNSLKRALRNNHNN